MKRRELRKLNGNIRGMILSDSTELIFPKEVRDSCLFVAFKTYSMSIISMMLDDASQNFLCVRIEDAYFPIDTSNSSSVAEREMRR